MRVSSRSEMRYKMQTTPLLLGITDTSYIFKPSILSSQRITVTLVDTTHIEVYIEDTLALSTLKLKYTHGAYINLTQEELITLWFETLLKKPEILPNTIVIKNFIQEVIKLLFN